MDGVKDMGKLRWNKLLIKAEIVVGIISFNSRRCAGA